ncbi:MAG TPA: exosortase H [Thermoanaerobaculia bacterium]|nr:exosortase H [Thermoanaerobaculia bacterium]
MPRNPRTNEPPDPRDPGTVRARKPLDRRQVVFLVAFVVLLGGGFTLLSLNAVDRVFVVPFTALVAKVSGWLLDVIGQDVTMRGTQIVSPRFAVDIKNGCNGLETVVVFASAVLAFPAAWRTKLFGLVGGIAAIQVINLVRVVALFLTGAYFPSFFDSSHTVVWQSIVVACGVLLFLVWASRWAAPRPPQHAEAQT